MDLDFRVLDNDDYKRIVGGDKDTAVQIGISLALGLGAFLTFCVRILDSM
jgi:hypothetical protein